MPDPDVRPVLITRPEPGAGETATRVARLGRRPILAPLLLIEARPALLPHPASIAAVLITSGNAIGALPDDYHAIPVMTVGHSTARQARQAGFAIVESADGDARALAALVLDRVDPAAGSLLLVSGRGQGITLAAALRSAGHRVIRRVTYTAIPATQLPEPAAALLRAGEAHVALFFSAETARTYVRLVRRAQLSDHVKTCEAVAIGGPAGVALEGLPWRRIRVAARPNQDEMFALLQ